MKGGGEYLAVDEPEKSPAKRDGTLSSPGCRPQGKEALWEMNRKPFGSTRIPDDLRKLQISSARCWGD